MRRLFLLLLVCGVAGLILAGCGGEKPSRDPVPILLEGRPVSSFYESKRDESLGARAKAAGLTLREYIAKNVKQELLGKPFGKGDLKKLKTFRYVYREVKPGTVKDGKALFGMAQDVAKAAESGSEMVGQPFLLIPESVKGWIFDETVRVGIPVDDAAKVPEGLSEGVYEGAMVFVNPGRGMADNGSLDEMERWAEQALRQHLGTEPDFNGPFLLRFAVTDSNQPGGVLLDWVIPADRLLPSGETKAEPGLQSAGVQVPAGTSPPRTGE